MECMSVGDKEETLHSIAGKVVESFYHGPSQVDEEVFVRLEAKTDIHM